MSDADLFYRFGIALAIGFLVGLQREFSHKGTEQSAFAGVRTFTLLSLSGCAAAFVAETAQAPALLAVFFGVVGALVIASYLVTARKGDFGSTTEVAELITVLSGALCYRGMLQVAAAIGVATTVVLSAKVPLKKLVDKLTTEDLVATLKFGVVTAIVLPVLPRAPLGPPPFDVLVPYDLWLMVVLISAIGFVGYVLIQVAGPKRGIGLTGIQRLSLEAAAQGVIVAAMANTALKGVIVLGTGSSGLRRRIWPAVAAILGCGLALALL